MRASGEPGPGATPDMVYFTWPRALGPQTRGDATMIKIIQDMPPGTIGLEAVGKVSVTRTDPSVRSGGVL
jgi:hypothetical protein